LNSDESELKDHLIQAFFRIKHLASSFHSGADSKMSELDLNMAELTLMKEIKCNALDSDENAFISDIQKQLYVSKAAISKMLASLEKKDYVNRDINRQNRRTLIVTLTPKGKEVLRVIEDDFDNTLMKIIQKLGKDNTEQFITGINRFADAINDVIQ